MIHSRAIHNRGKYFQEKKEPEKNKTEIEQVSTADGADTANRDTTLKNTYGSEYKSKKDAKSFRKAG